MSLVVSHETRRVAAAKPRRSEPERAETIAPQVDSDQAELLMDLFGEVLTYWCPRSVAELAATPAPPKPIAGRRAGLDVNFWYLDELGNRYIRKCSLELHCEDLTGQHLDVERVKLVHAPLVMEYLHEGKLLEDALTLVAPGGAFSAVLKLPEEFEGKVSRGQAPSIHRRKSQWSVINPIWMREAMAKYGFRLSRESRRTLLSGRKLWMGVFAK